MIHEVDLHVGRKIRDRRRHDGMTQRQLADAVGVNFQQMQKYETGLNRVSASRLWRIAEVQDAHISYYFDGLGDKQESEPIVEAQANAADMENNALNFLQMSKALPKPKRARLHALLKALSSSKV